MNVYPGPVFYNHVTAEAIEEIVSGHLKSGTPVDRWIYQPPAASAIQAALDRITF
ncbi:MAG: hypothetical protein ACRDJH_10930 [Thermomicrobiales bacterium]